MDETVEKARNPRLPEHGHEPVLLTEVLELLAVRPGATVVDCTLGRGGHALAIAGGLGPDGLLIGLDADPRNLAYAEERLSAAQCRRHLVNANFAELGAVLDEAGVECVDGLLADLGVSTNQLIDPSYGLGMSGGEPAREPAGEADSAAAGEADRESAAPGEESPLDMRLDPSLRLSAADLLARWPEKRIADVLYSLAQERYSRRIARKIVEQRRREPINTTGQLARLVRSVVPRPRPKYGRGRDGSGRPRSPIDPATRTFMALRMAVNRELDVLARLLEVAPGRLAPGGTMAVISFHSGEDRLVKHAFRRLASDGFELLTKRPIAPGDAETAANPRSRSARLRAIRRTA